MPRLLWQIVESLRRRKGRACGLLLREHVEVEASQLLRLNQSESQQIAGFDIIFRIQRAFFPQKEQKDTIPHFQMCNSNR